MEATMPRNKTDSRIWMTAATAALAVILAVQSGCGLFKKKEPDLPYVPLPDPTTLPAPSGGNVLSIDGEAVTVAEMADAMRSLLRPEAGRLEYDQFSLVVKPRVTKIVHSRVAEIVVYHEARKDFDTAMDDKLDQAVETEVRRYIARFNGDSSAAEKELADKRLTWTTFRDLQKRQILTQVYVQKQVGDPKTVTHNDLVSFYESIKDEIYLTPGMLQFRVVDIRADQVTLADPNQDRSEAARNMAEEVAIRARSGYDFAELAKQYSSDPSKDFGGLWNPVEPGSLAPPYDAIEKAAMAMEPNATSEPIAVGSHFFVIKVEKKQIRGYKPFEEVQRDVEARLESDRREKTFDSIMQKRLDLARIGDVTAFVDAVTLATYNELKQPLPPSAGVR
jgi:parvulin-like peptidyl-prolyl isomerase